MMFQPIEKQSASAKCATALRRAILSGELAVGQRLPPERQLAEDFGVNRLTLRAALAQLLGLGLVTVRQGSGYTVADVTRVGGPDLIPEILDMAREGNALADLIADLLDVRRSLALSVLGRLAKLADEEALDRIEAAIDDFEGITAVANSSLREFVDADFAIVAAMVDGTRSPIIRACINPVILAVAQIKELAGSMYINPKDNLAGHRLLLSWLRNPKLAPLQTIIDELAARDLKTVARMRGNEKDIA